MTHNERFDKILDECLTAVASGRMSVDECLERYPAYRAELAELLPLAVQMHHLPSATPSDAFRARSRQRLLHQLPNRQTLAIPTWRERWQAWFAPSRGMVWGMASAAVAFLLIILVWRAQSPPSAVVELPTPMSVAIAPTETTPPTVALPTETGTETEVVTAEQLATEIASVAVQLAETTTLTSTTSTETETIFRTSLDQLAAVQEIVKTAENLDEQTQIQLITQLDAQWEAYELLLLDTTAILEPTAVQSLGTQLLSVQQTNHTLLLAYTETTADASALRLAWASRTLNSALAWAEQGQLELATAALEIYALELANWQTVVSSDFNGHEWETVVLELNSQQATLAMFAPYDELATAAWGAWQTTATQVVMQVPSTGQQLNPTPTSSPSSPTVVPPTTISTTEPPPPTRTPPGQGGPPATPPGQGGPPATPPGQSGEPPGQGGNPPGQGGRP